MKTRFLSTFILVLALASLAGWVTLTKAQAPEPPSPDLSASPCPPGEPCRQPGSHTSWQKAPDEHRHMPAVAPLPDVATITSAQGSGGPDDYGYTWDDSVTFNWVDARSLGVNSGLSWTAGKHSSPD